MADHDQRMKVAVREFLAEFAGLTVPSWVGRYRLAEAEWQEQEVFLNPPQGERRVLDLVARVPLAQPIGPATDSLLHVEIESGDSLTALRERMPRYHHTLLYRSVLPVLSLALYLGVGLEGVGWDEAPETYWEEQLGTTRWRYLGLPRLDAFEYVEGDNILGVALSVLMRCPEDQQPRLKLRAMQRVAQAELNAYRRFLLMELIEAYLPLVGPHLQEYQRLLVTEEFQMVRALGQTTFEKGVEQGEERGVLKGQRELLLRQLERRFGPLSPGARTRLESWSVDRLLEAGDKLMTPTTTLIDLGLEDAPNGTAPPA
jgi:hypothetical protein